jgi:hypothetical protein
MRKFLLCFALVAAFACEDDNNNATDIKHKPYKLISYYDEIPDTTYFTYNGIYPIKMESANGIRSFEYSSNKLAKLKIYRQGDEIPWLYLQYDYNDNDQINKVSFYINVNSTVEEWTGEPIDEYRLSAYYYYEYLGDLVQKEYYIENNDTSFYSVVAHDLSGNMVTKTSYRKDALTGDYESSSIYNYSYDTKNHYYKDIFYPTFASYSSSQNNVITKERIYNAESNFSYSQYKYDELSYPILCITDQDTTWKIEYIDE